MLTRRALLASAAVSPLLAASHSPARAQVETPGEDAGGHSGRHPSGPCRRRPDRRHPLPLTGERLATFEAYVAAKLAEAGVPGAAVAVVQGGEVVFLQGFGVREIGQPEPVTADTLLRIGSVTKSFSSLLTATLVDAGRLSWETPLVDLLPTFAVADPDSDPATDRARRLLRLHRSPPARLRVHLQRARAHSRAADRGDGGAAPDRALRREVPVQQSDGGGGWLRRGGGRRRVAARPRSCLRDRAARAGAQPDRHAADDAGPG